MPKYKVIVGLGEEVFQELALEAASPKDAAERACLEVTQSITNTFVAQVTDVEDKTETFDVEELLTHEAHIREDVGPQSPTDFIRLGGKDYPTRSIYVPELVRPVIVSTDELSAAIFDAAGNYVSDEAIGVDEAIYFYVEKEHIGLPDARLLIMLREAL